MTAGHIDPANSPQLRSNQSPARRAGRFSSLFLLGVVVAAGGAMMIPTDASSTQVATGTWAPAPAASTPMPNLVESSIVAMSATSTDDGLFDAEAAAATAERTAKAAQSGRSSDREAIDERKMVELEIKGSRYTTTSLNIREDSNSKADVMTVLDPSTKVQITATKDGQWQQVVHKDEAGWVKSDYLAKDKPPSISTGVCSSGSGVESGLNSNAVAVHRAVCDKYSDISSIGGVRGGGGNHGNGRALDIMIRGAQGDEMASWLRSHADELGISEIIWEQKIWTQQRSGDGWRGMSNRGSDTANHMDHVHVSVY